MNKNKIPFNKVDQSILQDIAGQLVSNHVYVCQSMLVDKLMQKEVISVDDYENYYLSDEQLKKDYDVESDEEIQELRDNGSDVNEIFEHWVVSDWLERQLENLEEPLLKTDYQTWWGRTCTGQAIKLDHNIQKLAYQYSYDERLFEKEVA
jgi:hypothetical protein